MTNTNTARRPRLPRTMADLASHPWVYEISDERSSGAGIWVYLKPGYVWEGVSAIHENTVKDCCQAMRFVYFDQYVHDYLEPAPVEAAPIEAAPVEAAPVEAAPVEAAPIEAAPAPRLPRTMADLASHPWVESIDDARGSGHCLRVYLRPGFVWAETATSVIETTVEACCAEFRDVSWDPERWGDITWADESEVAALSAEAAPIEAAPIEAAPVEAAPVEAAPVEAAPVEAAIGRWIELTARAVAAVAVAFYAAGLTLGAAVHALNDWLAGVAPAAPAPAPARVAPPAVHPFAVITAAALNGLTGAAVAVAV